MAQTKPEDDLARAQALLKAGQEAEALKAEMKERVQKISSAEQALAEEIRALNEWLEGKPGEPTVLEHARTLHEDHPKPGSAPFKLTEVMGSKGKPMMAEEIASKIGTSTSTVKVYLSKFDCFKSAGRGQGYIYTPAASAESSKKRKGR